MRILLSKDAIGIVAEGDRDQVYLEQLGWTEGEGEVSDLVVDSALVSGNSVERVGDTALVIRRRHQLGRVSFDFASEFHLY